jgi:hypothetical protein
MAMRLDFGQIEVLDDDVAAVLRSRTEAERLSIAFRMWSFAHQTITNALRSEHVDWDEDRLQREVARRLSHGAI